MKITYSQKCLRLYVSVIIITAGLLLFRSEAIFSLEIESGIYGRAMSISDIATVPDSPMTGMSVLAVPREFFQEWFDSLDISEQFPTFPKDRLEPSMRITWTDHQGYYQQALNPGAYIVCRDLESAFENMYILQNCVEIDIRPGEMLSVNFQSGEMGRLILCEPSDRCRTFEIPYRDRTRITQISLIKYRKSYRFFDIVVRDGIIVYSDLDVKSRRVLMDHMEYKEVVKRFKNNGLMSCSSDFVYHTKEGFDTYLINVQGDSHVYIDADDCPEGFEDMKNEILRLWDSRKDTAQP